jgi:hypothetical protein
VVLRRPRHTTQYTALKDRHTAPGPLGDPDAITSHGGGYALGVDAANVDGLAVLRATATAARRLGDGNNRGTVEPPR